MADWDEPEHPQDFSSPRTRMSEAALVEAIAKFVAGQAGTPAPVIAKRIREKFKR